MVDPSTGALVNDLISATGIEIDCSCDLYKVVVLATSLVGCCTEFHMYAVTRQGLGICSPFVEHTIQKGASVRKVASGGFLMSGVCCYTGAYHGGLQETYATLIF